MFFVCPARGKYTRPGFACKNGSAVNGRAVFAPFGNGLYHGRSLALFEDCPVQRHKEGENDNDYGCEDEKREIYPFFHGSSFLLLLLYNFIINFGGQVVDNEVDDCEEEDGSGSADSEEPEVG